MVFRLALVAAAAVCTAAAAQTPTIRTLRVPDSGIQPQAAVASDGTLHLLYYKGDPKAGDLYYVTRAPGKPDFSAPLRVNSQPGSAVAIGNDRGGQLALGKNNRPHIAWNGSSKAEPKGPKSQAFSAENANNGLPMLYARLNDKGDAFEPQRNVMTTTFGLDGGGSVAADNAGHVYVVFHADPADASGKSESERRVFVAASSNDGATFSPEHAVSQPDLGACGCCGLKAFASGDGSLSILLRTAGTKLNRDTMWLRSSDQAATFSSRIVHPWLIASCPMSTASIAESPSGEPLFAWETSRRVFFATGAAIDQRHEPGLAPDEPERKYPALAVNKSGQILLAWVDGMSWSKAGAARWQLFTADGGQLGPPQGRAGPIPAWSLVAAIAEPDGSFTVIY